MKEQIKELLEKFNYQTSENVLTVLSQFLSNTDLPKNQYAIKHYSLFIKNHIKEIGLKKSHLIEMVSRCIFKEKWHILSKQIPKNFNIDMNSRMIQYGDVPIDLTSIDDMDLLADKILVITTKNNKEIQIIHEKADDLFRWCKANAFSNSVEYWRSGEKPAVVKDENLSKELPAERFTKSLFYRAYNEKAKTLLIEETKENVIYSLEIEGETRELLRQPISVLNRVVEVIENWTKNFDGDKHEFEKDIVKDREIINVKSFYSKDINNSLVKYVFSLQFDKKTKE